MSEAETKAANEIFSARFTDNPALKFSDISSEQYREYEFPNNVRIEINHPVAVTVSVSSVKPAVGSPHSHRVVDSVGRTHYIPSGWVRLLWAVKDGEKACSF